MTLAGPNPPKWPVAYHVQQTSICASVSVFCPPDYNTTFITSQSYMDSTAQRAGACDVNDWLSPSPFVSDQTFIYMWNETTLATDIYSLARGASNVTCSRTLLPGAWPPSNFLQPQFLRSGELDHARERAVLECFSIWHVVLVARHKRICRVSDRRRIATC